jgi:DNA (cytosine-5)-methyltransferase 1
VDGRLFDVDSTQNIISFCSGYAGLELGIERAGVDVRTICFVEREGFCIANLVAKIEEGRLSNAPIWTDLETFPASEFRGIVDGICCGYPCQPFSSSGKRQGEEDPRHLWPYLRKHIRTIRPTWVFAENVQGHITLGLSTVLSDLEEDGYRYETGIFSAEEVGAPHQRKRVFILGYSPSLRPHRGSENCEGEQSEVLGERLESDELANPTSREPRQSQARNGGQDIGGGSEEELANPKRRGCGKEGISRGVEAIRRGKSNNSMPIKESDTQWPARPGEEQYDWEEPRVIETQSKLGGESHAGQRHDRVDPIANRVDRLRLLGNGVCVPTAELAWKTLWKEMK